MQYFYPPLRAEGNLTYPEFILLVKKLWEDIYPDIPLRPSQGKNKAQYPCVIYRLENRTIANGEKKPRNRFNDQDHQNVITTGQRFRNIISFTCITQQDPMLAESIIEAFEDFMVDATPVFKKLGISDLFYSRRFDDDEINRQDNDLSARAVAYDVFTEKIKVTKVDYIEKIYITARKFIEEEYNAATPLDDAVQPVVILLDSDGTTHPN